MLSRPKHPQPPQTDRDRVVSPVICAVALLTGVAALVAAVFALNDGAPNGAEIALGIATLVAAEFAVARVRRDERGFAVFGLVPGIPLYSIRADRIHSVERADIRRPIEWGGWGYRIGSFGRGVILRSGPALTVRSTPGDRFTVSVRHPERFAPLTAPPPTAPVAAQE